MHIFDDVSVVSHFELFLLIRQSFVEDRFLHLLFLIQLGWGDDLDLFFHWLDLLSCTPVS